MLLMQALLKIATSRGRPCAHHYFVYKTKNSSIVILLSYADMVILLRGIIPYEVLKVMDVKKCAFFVK